MEDWETPISTSRKISELLMIQVEDLNLMLQQDQRWIKDATQSEHQAQVEMQAQAQRMKGSDLNSSNNSEGQLL